jgi:hypothetical protein
MRAVVCLSGSCGKGSYTAVTAASQFQVLSCLNLFIYIQGLSDIGILFIFDARHAA